MRIVPILLLVVLPTLAAPATPEAQGAPSRDDASTQGSDDPLPHLGQYVENEQPPEAIVKVPPTYPDDARHKHLEGTVLLEALVGKEGTVRDIAIIRSVPGLDEAASRSVMQWRFKPAMSNHKPIALWVAVPVKFALSATQELLGWYRSDVAEAAWVEISRRDSDDVYVRLADGRTTLGPVGDSAFAASWWYTTHAPSGTVARGRLSFVRHADGTIAAHVVDANGRDSTSETWRRSPGPPPAPDSTTLHWLRLPAAASDSLPASDTHVLDGGLPVLLTQPAPEFEPDGRFDAPFVGTVEVRALVGRGGDVRAVRVRGTPREWVAVELDPILDAVSHWRFRPAKAHGRPVATWVTIPLRFTVH